MVAHHDWLLPIDSHNPLNMCSWEVMSEILFIYHHNAYGRKTYQCSVVTQGTPTHTFICPFNEVIMWGHMTNWVHYISTSRGTMNTKLGKVLTYSERQPFFKATWPFDHVTNVGSSDNLKIPKLLGRVLTYASRFSLQTLKSLSTSCYHTFNIIICKVRCVK